MSWFSSPANGSPGLSIVDSPCGGSHGRFLFNRKPLFRLQFAASRLRIATSYFDAIHSNSLQFTSDILRLVSIEQPRQTVEERQNGKGSDDCEHLHRVFDHGRSTVSESGFAVAGFGVRQGNFAVRACRSFSILSSCARSIER